MADVITLSSSDEESESRTPPKKRIKPTPVFANLPQISITKVIKPKPLKNKQDVVVVCLDEDEEDEDEEDEDEEDVTFVDAATISELETQNKENNKSNGSGSISEVLEVKDDEKVVDNTELTVDLKDSCEIINEDSCEESSGKENIPTEQSKKDSQPGGSGETETIPNIIFLDKLIAIIDDQTNEEKYQIVKKKLPLLRYYYKKCKEELVDSIDLKNMLLSNIEKAKKSPALAVISFNDVFQHLSETTKADTIEVEDKAHVLKLRKLEKAIKRIVFVIKKLEDEEVDFDAEENSSYIQVDRYTARLHTIYQKYCKLMKKNPYAGRITHSKLDFVDSEFLEINRAISKKYKNNSTFPSYYEMEMFIKKVAKEKNLDLSETKIKSESVHCFKKLGELLQTRRRKDLYDSHYMLIKDSEDPAKDDTELNKTLESSYLKGQDNIDKLVQMYVTKEDSKEESGSRESGSDKESDKSSSAESEIESDNDK